VYRTQDFNPLFSTRRSANRRDCQTLASEREVLAIPIAREHRACRRWHAVLSRFRSHVQRLRRGRAPRAGCPSFKRLGVWEEPARSVEQVGLRLRHAMKAIVMVHQTRNATTRVDARSKERSTLPNSTQNLTRPGAGPPAEPASQHTRLGGGTPPDILSRRCSRRERGRRRAASASARGPWPRRLV
jgi:hypothetical protein